MSLPEDPFKYDEYYQRKVKPYLDRPIGFWILFVLLLGGFLLTLGAIWNLRVLSEDYNLVIVVTILLAVSLLVWLLLRRLPKFGEDEAGILVALFLINYEADKELTLLYRKLESILNRESLKTKVVLKFLPPRLIPKNEKDAHEIREKTKAKLVIWGDVDSGSVEAEKQIVFKPVYFSYEMRLPKDRLEIFNKNLSAILQKRKWVISERDNIIAREYLANNLEEISFYILGIALFLSGKNTDSLELLKPLLKKYETKLNTLSNDDKVAAYNIGSVIGFIYSTRIKSLNLWPESSDKEVHIQVAKTIVEELGQLKILGSHYLLKSIVRFHEGNIPEAINSAKLSEKNSNPEDPAPNFSLAFLYFYQEDLASGFRKLQRALKAKRLLEMGDQGVSLIRWYEDILKTYPDRRYLNYPLGVLYYELSGDVILAKECLSLFLSVYKKNSNKIIKQMCYEAEKRLKKLNK